MMHFEQIKKNQLPALSVSSLFGKHTFTEPVLLKLLDSKPVQRLKRINQYGISYFTFKPYSYTRFDHSVGVMHLIQRYGGSITEQIAGLLHDVSHTAFSHVAELVFNHNSETNSYQDDIHRWFIEQTELPELLEQYGFTVEQILHKQATFRRLEQPLPELCADRLEYILQGGFLEQMITKDEITNILKHIHFSNNQWWFDTIESAQTVAHISISLTIDLFGAAPNCALYHLLAHTLRRARDINVITTEMIHFSDDETLWNILCTSTDAEIKHFLHQIKHFESHLKFLSAETAHLHFFPKFRGINPWVMTNTGLQRLIELDPHYAHLFESSKNHLKKGIHISIECEENCL